MEFRDVCLNGDEQQPISNLNRSRPDEQTELYEYTHEPRSIFSRFISSFTLPRSSNLLDSMPSNINRTLFFAKLFYFWYFAAFGSLFPLMSIYFKQMGMGPSYCGILMGFRPFVEFISAPFWSVVSTRFRQAKNILMMAILSWIIFTIAIGLIKPPPHSCWREMNATHQLIERVSTKTSSNVITPPTKVLVKRQLTKIPSTLTKTTAPKNSSTIARRKTLTTKSTTTTTTTSASIYYDDEEDDQVDSYEEDNPIDENNRPSTSKLNLKGTSTSMHLLPLNKPSKTIGNPLSIRHTNYSLVKPVSSTILYDKKDVRNVFMVFLLLIIIGEFFSAPAMTLADACTLSYLGQDTELYGRQRMFGSLGWGLAIFTVATILGQSKSFTFHACGTSGPLEKNYTICFAAFSICMTLALFSASRFEFSYDKSETVPLRTLNQDLKRHISPTNKNIYVTETPIERSIKQHRETTIKYMQLIQIFLNVKNGSFLFIAWWMGCGVGLIFTFLFWHLQDLGGSPTLFGVASVINHGSELLAYFFLHELIHRFGHIKILYFGLLGNFIRFVYISIIRNPWWVLPVEFIQGWTHAAVWATACSYLSQSVPPNLRISCQGILQGFHFGFGRGFGAFFGGFIASYVGTDITFRIYGVLCLLLVLFFIYLHQKYQHHDLFNQLQADVTANRNFSIDDPHEFVGNSPLLTPYGAPANPKWQRRISAELNSGIRLNNPSIHSNVPGPIRYQQGF